MTLTNRFIVFLFSMLALSECQRDIRPIPYNGKINKIRIMKEKLIVAGNGFVAYVKQENLNTVGIKQQANSNFSVLGTREKDYFFCSSNTTHANCFFCLKEKCQEKVMGLSLLQSFIAMQNDNSLLFISSTTSTNKDKKFISKLEDPLQTNPKETVLIRWKPEWTCEVESVIEFENSFKGIYYGIGKIKSTKDGQFKSIMFKIFLGMRQSDYDQKFVENVSGQIINVNPPIENEALYLIATDSRIKRIATKFHRSDLLPHTITFSKVDDNWKVQLRNMTTTVEEVNGVIEKLLSGEKITSGLILNNTFLFLATSTGRLLKVSESFLLYSVTIHVIFDSLCFNFCSNFLEFTIL